MERKLIGKFLVRRATNNEGKEVLVLCGSFYPKNFKANEIDSGDEMWVADITIHDGGARFSKVQEGVDAGSPEEFLEGRNQRPEDWKSKEEL
jgi:hypothetical protein